VKQTLRYVGLALVAGALGATAGVLLAPASGRETRRRVRRRVAEEREALLQKGQRAVEGAAGFLQGQFQEKARQLRKAVSA
jgi:gas vesicle protein